MPQLKKVNLYNALQRITELDDKLYSQDVARLVHCHLLAGLFTPNGNTSLAWSTCEFVEDLGDICLFDWCNLILKLLVKELIQTKNMKIAGCSMLLPVSIVVQI